MKDREFYGVRKGHIPKKKLLSLEHFKKAFSLVYKDLERVGYFQKYFGKQCPDEDDIGLLGDDLETSIFLKTGLQNVWPLSQNLQNINEFEFYTLLEFLHDTCATPLETFNHEWQGCGLHVKTANDEMGQKEFRERINPLLKRYKNVELSDNGEIMEVIEEGFEPLFKASIPTDDDQNITMRINAAILKFRRASSTNDDRRDALRDLADVLEYIKPSIQKLSMSKDSNELFEIANTFGIRHHNPRQKTDYDKAVWHSWIFYCYLSTIHLCLRLINMHKT
jgi:hypothetical protein